MRKLVVVLGALLLVAALPVMAGSYHAGAYINCSDCHTMHASIHDNQGTGTPASTTPSYGGTGVNAWLPASTQGSPIEALLKDEPNALCTACHDGQSFAPDVFETGSYTYARSAGALRKTTGGGHKLGSTVAPPGYNYAAIGAKADTYVAGTTGLECISCHSPHGSVGIFRNLVPYQWTASAAAGGKIQLTSAIVKPTDNVSATFDGSKDANINYAGPYVPGTVANWGGYYGASAVRYGRQGTPISSGTTHSSNRLDTFCGACHGDFHGGADAKALPQTISDVNTNDGTNFLRHPTSVITMGTNEGNYDHASKVGWQKAPLYFPANGYAPTAADVSGASPGCVSCHKAHGNNNPFGLLYIGAGSLSEEGSSSGTYVNLCHQCHSMGSSNADGTKTW